MGAVMLALGMAGMCGTIAYHMTGSGIIAVSWVFGGGNIAILALVAVAYVNRQ